MSRQRIDFDEDKKLLFETSKGVQATQDFEDMGLSDDMMRGMATYGFEKPSAVQQRALLPILGGRDVIAQAQTGTGKTAMFCIGALELVDRSINATQSLILSPTRELAEQSKAQCMALGDFMNISVHAVIGGKSLAEDIRRLDAGVQIVSGTPGRVYDMIKRSNLQTRNIKVLILDEADTMLSKGFKQQIYDIYRHLPATQVILVSMSLPAEVLEMTTNFMVNPVRILVKRDELSLRGIRQYFVDVEKEEWKFATLCDLYDSLTITQAVIFCNTREKVDQLRLQMQKEQFTVLSMHAGMPQAERDTVMKSFRDGKGRVLITTDIFSRGLDIKQVTLVMNYDLPSQSRETYLHRIGRAGRFGRNGVAISLVTKEEISVLRDIEQFYSTQIEELPDVGGLMADGR
eukprot:TRINITY_DN27413_c0_g1_i1.p1 TRINITY_DN27413_c0_g1~~TRINITY_DN27413_c0_g1_i1.p1  ORF type:complete len:403 (+),score=177.15 TRINITY_DN27413_c0_g1_i1:56-1264(+)